MKTYIYETESLKYNTYIGRAKEDYLKVIAERGLQGWRFVCFVPLHGKVRKVKGLELVFEKEIESTIGL